MIPDEEKQQDVRKPNQWRWFLVGIFVMGSIVITLTLAALLQQRSGVDVSIGPDRGLPIPEGPIETTAAELDSRLNEASSAALNAAKMRLDPLLDQAYRPVFAAIPAYTNFHYSVYGEYAELTQAALGAVGKEMEEMLFAGLETRLQRVNNQVDSAFTSAFTGEINANLAAMEAGNVTLGPLTEKAVENSVNRMQFTVPIGMSAALGSAGAVKAASGLLAKKMATKLAVKAAAKAGGKWTVVMAGAGGGAALCSWSGPGAGLCAAAGGVGAWLIADHGIVKLDEYWNREEFEADLVWAIEEHKIGYKRALEQALATRAVAVQAENDKIVQQHDFTLRELSDEGVLETCAIATELSARYNLLRQHLRDRNPETLKSLRDALASHEQNISLNGLVREIEQNLQQGMEATLSDAQISGLLPAEYRANRDISGNVKIDGYVLDVPKTRLSSNDTFAIGIIGDTNISFEQPLNIEIALEQHLRINSHRLFGGSAEIDVFDAVGVAEGVSHMVRITIPIIHDIEADSLDEVFASSKSGQALTLTFQVLAKQLTPLINGPHCK